MPAEWAPHAATWMSWPFDEEMWFGELTAVRQEYAALVRTLSAHEPVHLFVRDDEAEASARAQLAGTPQLTMHRQPLDDVWMRDNGPIFVLGPAAAAGGGKACVNWRFNAWGGKYDAAQDDRIPPVVAAFLGLPLSEPGLVMEGGALEINGAGLCITTEQCLLTPTRNPGLTKSDLEDALHEYLGITEVLWLGQGLEGDHTDGHVDTITRFVAERHVVTSVCDDTNDPNYAVMQANLAALRAFRDRSGAALKVTALPLPAARYTLADGTRLPVTYANFYIANGVVVVPQYGDVKDQEALALLSEMFAGRRVVGLASRAIIRGGGSFHCLTQQEPAFDAGRRPL